VAADLGIGLSTLRNWIDRRRDREMEQPPPDRQEDMAAELKRCGVRTRCCARSARS
jgi:transposase